MHALRVHLMVGSCFGAQAKVLVFLSTCKQVKYVFEAFRRLRPGVPLRCIHGKMKQMKRMATFYKFSEVCAGCPASLLLKTLLLRRCTAPCLHCTLDGCLLLSTHDYAWLPKYACSLKDTEQARPPLPRASGFMSPASYDNSAEGQQSLMLAGQ